MATVTQMKKMLAKFYFLLLLVATLLVTFTPFHFHAKGFEPAHGCEACCIIKALDDSGVVTTSNALPFKIESTHIWFGERVETLKYFLSPLPPSRAPPLPV